MLLFNGLKTKSGVSWLFFDFLEYMYVGLVLNIAFFSWKSSNIWHTDVFFYVVFPRRLSRRIIQNYMWLHNQLAVMIFVVCLLLGIHVLFQYHLRLLA